jgi:protein-L-isoaspartate(D-aspartate) O-methyltransferase
MPLRIYANKPKKCRRKTEHLSEFHKSQDIFISEMNRYRQQRLRMLDSQLRSRGITDERVLKAMEKVPRHLFVDEGLLDQAYSDGPLPIGSRQTISQPYIVALMTEALELKGKEKVLEIGTGCGYQTAILAELSDRVFSIERIASLAAKARRILDHLNYYNVLTRVGDGTYGWREEAPFDAIIVTAGAPEVPSIFMEQLAVGGRLVIPIGNRSIQTLTKITRLSENVNDTETEDLGGCRFVDLIGEYGWKA